MIDSDIKKPLTLSTLTKEDRDTGDFKWIVQKSVMILKMAFLDIKDKINRLCVVFFM